jgi:hypothetical protein
VPPDRKLDHEGHVPLRQFCFWMIFQPEQDVNVRPLNFSSKLDALSQADLTFKPLPLCLQGDGQATSEDHIDLTHLILIVGIGSKVFASLQLLRHRCWWWHLLAVQKSFALFQIMSMSMMNLTPLICIS